MKKYSNKENVAIVTLAIESLGVYCKTQAYKEYGLEDKPENFNITIRNRTAELMNEAKSEGVYDKLVEATIFIIENELLIDNFTLIDFIKSGKPLAGLRNTAAKLN